MKKSRLTVFAWLFMVSIGVSLISTSNAIYEISGSLAFISIVIVWFLAGVRVVNRPDYGVVRSLLDNDEKTKK